MYCILFNLNIELLYYTYLIHICLISRSNDIYKINSRVKYLKFILSYIQYNVNYFVLIILVVFFFICFLKKNFLF